MIEACELAKLAKTQLDVDESAASAARSQYKRGVEDEKMQRFKRNKETAPKTKCWGCGSSSHRTAEREKNMGREVLRHQN